jgi:catecholate siderophore receptor
VVRYVPGVQMAQGEGHRDAPILRGNTTTADFFINGMRDDVQYYRDLYNVERVEVLKGPAGMIFGRGASGGLINRVTKQADWTNSRGVNVTLGSWDNRRVVADYDQAWNDSAAFRITGLYEDSDS